MKKLNEESKNSTLLSLDSLGKNDLIQLLDGTNRQNIKKHHNKNELFQAEFDILNYVINLRKRTIKTIEDEENFSYRKKRTKIGQSTSKRSKIKKNNELKKNLSFNSNLNIQTFGNRNQFITYQKDKKIEKENNEIDKLKDKQKFIFIKNQKSKKQNFSSDNLNIKNELSIKNDNQKEINSDNYKSNTYKTFSHKKSLEENKNNKINKNQFRSYLIKKKVSKSTNSSKKKKKSNNSLKSNIMLERSLLEDELENDKNNFSGIKKPKIFDGDNDSETIFLEEENNKKSYLQLTNLTNKNILQLNELRKELKRSIVGKNEYKGIGKKSFLFEDDDNYLENLKEEENENTFENNYYDNFKERYRILTRKGYVYDSFDDEENNDEEISFNFIYPESNIIICFDLLDVIFNFYNLIFIPLYLGMNDMYFVRHKLYFSLLYLFNILNDIVYFIDIFIPFFVAYYNFDEQLIIKLKLIVQNYLGGFFIINLLSGIPYFTLFIIFEKKRKRDIFLHEPFFNNNLYYLFILFRLLKLIKISSNNYVINKIRKEFSKIKFFSFYGRIIISILIFIISLHIISCVFIFIGKNHYPNWIYYFNHNNKNFPQLYLISIYYIMTTLTTVGYGDITCISFNEKFFGLFMEIVGICAYSWALTAMSNYIKIINDKSEELYNKIKILDNIKLTYPQFSDNLYERIIRYLKYKHFHEKKGNNNIIEELPIGLRNSLIYEMYKPIIKNFIFFKDFTNEDFIVKIILALKPILALKNDILIKDGDLVEDIIFVKRGRLSLELPLIMNFHKKKEKKSGSHNSIFMKKATTLLYNNFTREATFNKGLYNFKPNNKNSSGTPKGNKFSINEKEQNDEVQYFRILEIRRNEHFGDILMFLDQRSLLCLKVKSKKAELFFLNKEDAVGISANYPQYWKIINKKSLFNMEQIKRLTNRLINILTHEHGIVTKKTKKYKNTEFTSSISLIEDGDDDLKSVPTIVTQESKEHNFSQLNTDDEKNEFLSKNKLNENNEYYINRLKTDNNSNYRVKFLKTITEGDDKESSDKFSNESENLNKNDKSKINEKEIVSNFSKWNYEKYKFRSYKKIIKKRNTPYEFDEINDEIYPEESFIVSPQLNNNYVFSNKKLLESMNLDSNKNNSNNYFNNNISICTTEISFSINSEYENIDELSEHNYSKDKAFRNKIKHHIKKELGNIKNENFKSENEDNYVYGKYNLFNKKTYNENDFTNRRILRNKKHNTYKEKNFTPNFDIDKKRFSNKKDILTVISQKIEKDNMNLNNPDLFYSSVFMKFMDKKLTQCEDQNMEMNKEEMDFIQRIENMGNLRTFNTKKTKG